jgi:hypothetical protein
VIGAATRIDAGARNTRTRSGGTLAVMIAIASIPATTALHTACRAAGDFTRAAAIASHAIAASASTLTVTLAR